MSSTARVVAICLFGLAAALLVVGAVSATVLRHCIQVAPIAVALVVLRLRPRWGAYSALPIFTLWTLIAVLIWLYLLGVSRVITGTFGAAEIACTIAMAAFSIVGAVRSISLGRPFHPAQLIAFAVFLALQVAALQVSFRVATTDAASRSTVE